MSTSRLYPECMTRGKTKNLPGECDELSRNPLRSALVPFHGRVREEPQACSRGGSPLAHRRKWPLFRRIVSYVAAAGVDGQEAPRRSRNMPASAPVEVIFPPPGTCPVRPTAEVRFVHLQAHPPLNASLGVSALLPSRLTVLFFDSAAAARCACRRAAPNAVSRQLSASVFRPSRPVSCSWKNVQRRGSGSWRNQAGQPDGHSAS